MLPMENGYVGYPKFKRRKVSAVRDFPRGCVPAPRCILIQEEEKIELHSDENLVIDDKNGIMAEANCTDGSTSVDDSHLVNFASIPSGDVSKKIPTKNYPSRRRVSAVRDFPPGCGSKVPSLCKEHFQEVRGSPKKQHLSEDNPDTVLEQAKKADLKKIELVVRDGNSYLTKTGLKRSRGSADGYAEEDNLLTTDAEKHCQDQDVNRLENKLDKGLQSDLKQSGVHVRNKNETDSKRGESDIIEVKAEAECDANLMIEMVSQDGLSKTSGVNKVQLDSEILMESAEKHDKYQLDSMPAGVDIKGTTDDRAVVENLENEIVVYEEKNKMIALPSDSTGFQKYEQEEDMNCLERESTRMIVHGLMAAPNCPWRQKRGSTGSIQATRAAERKRKKHVSSKRKREEPEFCTRTSETLYCSRKIENKSLSFVEKTPKRVAGPLVVSNKEDAIEDDLECKDFRVASSSQRCGVSLPPFGFNNSSGSIDENESIVTRQKVRETLRLFQAVCRKLLQEEEAKSKGSGNSLRRVDLQAAKILKEKGKSLHTGKKVFGAVPGVEVGDEFHYRVELHIIGIHGPIQAGIDYIKHEGKVLATSIVASGGYEDDLDNPDFLIYTGSGGNVTKGGKEVEDQKLDRGNLALKNSIDAKYPVRVIRGFKEAKSSELSDVRTKVLCTYTYDGLYMVERYWQEPGPLGKLVFKFQLGRLPGQPELAWREVKNSKKNKIREGLCLADISQGKEKIPICAVNTVDKESTPVFTYVTRMIYPNWLHPVPPRGCDCSSGCTDSKCFCAVKNGGEVPYNLDGAIVEAKPLVYECGPRCRCPPSCRNRVSQNGIKFQLEIFKTEQRGWGVRSLNSIPSGSFVCEYVGELLEDKEAEERTGNDEYLFDIGSNFNEGNLWDDLSSLMPDAHSNATETVDQSGFTIDAAKFGSVGRFINHSCSPNLYAQNVLYDHEDKRIPHVMLFAAENIPPLQELTYHYNYMIDQVHDSAGNIKKKNCYCGSLECTGRLY